MLVLIKANTNISHNGENYALGDLFYINKDGSSFQQLIDSKAASVVQRKLKLNVKI